MKTYLNRTWGVIAKDLRQWARDRQAMFPALLLPLVMMVFAAILFGFGGDEWNIGLVVEGDGPEAQRLAQAIETSQGNISPYFHIVTRDADTAGQLVEATFGQALSASGSERGHGRVEIIVAYAQAELVQATEQDRFERSQTGACGHGLRQVGDAFARCVESRGSGLRFDQADSGLKHGRLAGAIGADQGADLTVADVK